MMRLTTSRTSSSATSTFEHLYVRWMHSLCSLPGSIFRALACVIILLILSSYPPVRADSVLIANGDTVTTGRVTASKFINYTINNGVLHGTLSITVIFVRAPFQRGVTNSSQYYTLPSTGSIIDAFFCFADRKNPLAINNCTGFIPYKNIRCTAADKSNYNTCMNRLVGSAETFEVPVKISADILAGSLFCIRSTTYYEGNLTVSSSIPPYNDPYFVCQGEAGAPETPPELNNSVCSLNAQQINMSYTSESLAVDGLRQDATLSVNCTAGTPQNYSVRLTGTNVTAGRLNFGNGVSAEVSLNNQLLTANGSAIRFDGLSSRTMPVSTVLRGTASSPGVSNAAGILILDAL